MKIELKETVNLPLKSVRRLFDAISVFESAQNEIEDFLIVRNKRIMNSVRKSRDEHLKGKVKDFRNLIKKYV